MSHEMDLFNKQLLELFFFNQMFCLILIKETKLSWNFI